jgi:hypothetical protein
MSTREHNETTDGTYEKKRHMWVDDGRMRMAMLAAPQLEENVREHRRQMWSRHVPRCYAVVVEFAWHEKVVL